MKIKKLNILSRAIISISTMIFIVGCNVGQGTISKPEQVNTLQSSNLNLTTPINLTLQNTSNGQIKFTVPDSDNLDCRVNRTDGDWYNCGNQDAVQNSAISLDGYILNPGHSAYIELKPTNLHSHNDGPSLEVYINDKPGFMISHSVNAYNQIYVGGDKAPIWDDDSNANVYSFFTFAQSSQDIRQKINVNDYSNGSYHLVFSDEFKPFAISEKTTIANDKLCFNDSDSCASFLLIGQNMISSDGSAELVLQADGNLVIYTKYGNAIWASNTTGSGAIALELSHGLFGNLSLYNSDGTTVWTTGTTGSNATSLTLQNDGNLVLYRDDFSVAWSTNSNKM